MLIAFPHCPNFVDGDGNDPNGDTGNEVNAGTFTNPQDCINACMEKAKNEPAFNGVTIRNDNKCRCKRTVVSTNENSNYKTCVFGK